LGPRRFELEACGLIFGRMGTRTRSFDWPGAALVAAATLGALALGGFLSPGSDDPWYAALRKAPLNPPDIAFAIIWPVLFALMLAGALMVLHAAGSFKRASAEMGLYFTMLAANVCWSLFFFGFRDPAIALGVLIALWLLLVTMMLRFAVHSPRAALLQVPYLCWVTFAAYLNIYVWVFNPAP
jgi:tryptophan-rich sensory protein